MQDVFDIQEIRGFGKYIEIRDLHIMLEDAGTRFPIGRIDKFIIRPENHRVIAGRIENTIIHARIKIKTVGEAPTRQN